MSSEQLKKWIYLEDAAGCLIGKTYCNPREMFNALKAHRWVISTRQKSDLSVVYRIYK